MRLIVISALCCQSVLPWTLQSRRQVVVSAAMATLFSNESNPLSISQATEECDSECLAERQRIIQERRAMMQQSRTTRNRQDMFDLSRQRAALYNTTYQGATCRPGVPCW